jgi:membrane AbrB-like protein
VRRQGITSLLASLSNLGGLPSFAQWLALAAVSAAFTTLLTLAGLPAALFLGAMAGGVALGVNGAAIRVPRIHFAFAQSLIGMFIASAITPSILRSFVIAWPVILSVVFAIIAASSLLGYVMSRWRVMPGTTSIWGSWPGAASAMVIMAAEFGADARLVAFMQYLRVACVAGLASIVAAVWAHSTGIPHPAPDWFPDADWPAILQTVLLAGACAGAGRILKIPSGPMLLALFLGSLAHLSGAIEIELPRWLMAATYALLGWTVGLGFTPAILAHALRAVPKILLSIMILIAFSGALAWLLTQTLGIDALTAYLATSPGGLDAIAIIAASTHADAPFVLALQTIRFLTILLIGPPLARLVARHMEEDARGAEQRSCATGISSPPTPSVKQNPHSTA